MMPAAQAAARTACLTARCRERRSVFRMFCRIKDPGPHIDDTIRIIGIIECQDCPANGRNTDIES